MLFQLPFHDARSFARFLRNAARDKGMSLDKIFENGVIDRSLYYRYLANERDPKLSTIFGAIEKLAQQPRKL